MMTSERARVLFTGALTVLVEHKLMATATAASTAARITPIRDSDKPPKIKALNMTPTKADFAKDHRADRRSGHRRWLKGSIDRRELPETGAKTEATVSSSE